MAGDTARNRSPAIRTDPRYTGENRCLPCTAVNLAIAGVGAAAAGVALGGVTGPGLLIAAGTFTAAASIVYYRGYLVPGTPTLTRRYLSEGVLAWFGKDQPDRSSPTETTVETDVDPEALFGRLGIVEPASDGDDLALTATFESAWLDAVGDFAATSEALRSQVAAMAGVDAAGLDLDRTSESFDAYYDGRLIARWESKPACQADVAAAAIMPLFDPDWSRRPYPTRSELLGALRMFLETCPTCRGDVALSHEVVQSCCSSRDVVAATCQGCNARVFEVGVDLDRFAVEAPARPETAR